jgi:uncharacterized protein YdaL
LWVYICTPAELALQWIRKRARVEEAGMTLQYLQTLDIRPFLRECLGAGHLD